MDSLTQAALGAAVAEAGMGRRIGNKAILWGVALGTLPDLDILANPWLDHIQQLEWHRGPSHSLLVMLAASPFLGWLISKSSAGKVGPILATWTALLVLLTHSLIDVFTVYGTMIFAPITDYRVGLNNLFIIDPLFTAPLLMGLLVALFCKPVSNIRRLSNRTGIALAAVYVLWSFSAKGIAHYELARSLRAHGIPYQRLMTAPTPFNTILWRGIAEDTEGFWIGYHSLLKPSENISFEFLPKNKKAFAQIQDAEAFKRLVWFSNGFLTVEQIGNAWIASDWRFGELRPSDAPLSATNPAAAVFSWRLEKTGNTWETTPLRERRDLLPHLTQLRNRLR